MALRGGLSTTLNRSIARSVGGRGAGSAALDILASVGTSTSPTSTGTKAVTGVGFTPKVVLPFTHWSPNATDVQSLISIGAATSSSSRAYVAASSQNAVTTSNTHRRHVNNEIIGSVYNNTTSVEADLASMDSDGFTLNWSPVSSTALLLNHICLGGADLEVSLTQHQMNSTNAAQSFAHGLTGGAPTALLFFSALNTIAPVDTTAELRMSIGFYDGTNQVTAGINSSNAVTTTLCQRTFRNDSVLAQSPSISRRAMAVSSVDATNVNCSYPIAFSSAQSYFWMLAIRGAKAQVGTFDCNGSLDPLTIATPGITPKLFLPVMITAGITNMNNVVAGLGMSIGASDGTNTVSCGITDEHNVTTTNARRFQSSDSIIEYRQDGVREFEATVSFNGNQVVITPEKATALYGQGGYLILGS